MRAGALDLEAMRYPPEDDRPHAPGADPSWQESYVVSWWDDTAGIGGFTRLGRAPHEGTSSVLFGVLSADGTRFRRNDEGIALPADKGPDRFVADRGHWASFDEGLCFEAREPDCDLSLSFEDFYEPFNYFTATSDSLVGKEVAPDHYQVGGRVTGTARLGDRTYEIDGLGHRDHSWGPRRWQAIVGHRWFAGTLGPELSFSLITTYLDGGQLSRLGLVVRDGEVFCLSDVDVVVHLEPDGLTHRGGVGTGRLPDGSELRFESEVADGLVIEVHGLRVVEGIGRVRIGDKVGFCDLEQSNNPAVRAGAAGLALRAASVDGLSRR